MKWRVLFWLVVILLAGQAIFFAFSTNQNMSEKAETSPAVLSDAASIEALRLSGGQQLAKLVFDLRGEGVTLRHVSALDPDRLIFTLEGAQLGAMAQQNMGQAAFAKIHSITTHTQGQVQVEVQLDQPAQVSNILNLPAFQDLPARIVVDIEITSKALFIARVQQSDGAASDNSLSVPDDHTVLQRDSADTSNRLIVIDPGHGGIDSGAVGPGGLLEKHFVFEFAMELARQLVATGRYDVALTRTEDVFLSLDQRLNVARQNKADLFISIHADSFSDPNVQGASVYYLDEDATDMLDKILAENENRVDLLHGIVSQNNVQVVDVLVDLMRRSTKRQSFNAAQAVADGLSQTINTRRFPARGGNFFVLKAPDVPSILLELGFMSNINDVQNFKSYLWRERAIIGIVRAVGVYFDLQDIERVQLPDPNSPQQPP